MSDLFSEVFAQLAAKQRTPEALDDAREILAMPIPRRVALLLLRKAAEVDRAAKAIDRAGVELPYVFADARGQMVDSALTLLGVPEDTRAHYLLGIDRYCREWLHMEWSERIWDGDETADQFVEFIEGEFPNANGRA